MRHQLQQDHSTLEDDKESRMAEEASNMAPGDICAGNSMVLEPIEACVHSLIERIAWERPSAPAICSWDGDLTYQQLDQASSKLAHQLVHVGVKLQTKVALCFERTWLAPVSILAVMKAGAASITLDLSQPKEQLQAIISKISASIFLSSSTNEQLVRQLGAVEVVVVGNGMASGSVATPGQFHELPVVQPSHILCVGFDSDYKNASVITHRGFSSAIIYQQRVLGLTANSRVFDLESYSSRVAWYSLLTLACGGCLCIPSSDGLQEDIEGSVSSLRANYAVLAPTSALTPGDSKLSQLVQLKHIADLGILSDINDLENETIFLNFGASSDLRVASRTTNGSKSSSHAENGQTADGYRDHGLTVTIENGRYELQVEPRHDDLSLEGQIVDRRLEDENNGHLGQDKQGGPLVSVEKKERTKTHCEPVKFSDRPDGSISSAQANTKLRGSHLRGPAIPPFSLLSSCSSMEKGELCAHAARLCHVQETQVVDMMPCTPLQEGLLALTAKRAGEYIARFVFEIGRGIDRERFIWVWDQVVVTNPILRTRIISLPGLGIMQVVIEEEVSWTLSTNLEDYQAEKTGNGTTMGLGTPLTRFGILESVTGYPRQFIWEIHHALYDGFSMPLLLKEADNTYFNEESQALEPMTRLIKYIMNRDKSIEKAFWRKVFANNQSSHFPSPKASYHPRADCHMSLTISGLEWGRGDFTPATIVRAAWSVIVANGAGSNEALFGVTVTGRQAPVPGIELIAGPTIATVPIRLILDWDASFNHLLNAVQRQVSEMIPFEQTGLQRIAQISEETALESAFQTLLVVQPAAQSGSESSSRFLSEPVEDQDGTKWNEVSIYSIVIECLLDSDEVQVRIGFDSSIIGQQQMELIARNFEYTLGQLSDSKQGDQTLRILADDQWSLDHIWAWNAVVPEPTEACIHDLISQKVRETPSAVAISAWDGDLTYRQLDNLSSSLAHQLSEKGVARTLVPLVFEKSMFMPVATLAVMKAGGACVALDIKQPRERLYSIAAQANSSVIVSSVQNEFLAHQLGANTKETVVVGPDQSRQVSVHSNLPPVSPSHVLYVVFTSGTTTGTPKGVVITHRNFCSAITCQQKPLGFTNTSRVFDFASYAFDAAWGNLLHALTVGGTLCIPSQIELENDLSGCLEKYNVTIVDLTSSVARIVSKKALSSLTTLILGGEAVLPGDAYLADGKTKIINVCGPAECTPTATFAEVTADDVGIGYGAGACTWVVNHDARSLASVGSIGELFLEGPLVGDGYLNDPEKTAASFVEDPPWLLRGVLERPGLPGRPGRRGRLYRTGDLVRYKEDGSLVFIGRKDTQVKIRGQRVELGAIEQHVLDTIRPLLSAEGSDLTNFHIIVETIQPKEAISAILVAFVTLEYARDRNVTEESHATVVHLATEALADQLMDKLPIYMVPTAFIPIYKLPMTTTGKTDRRQLRAIAESVFLQYRKTTDKKKRTESLSELEKIIQQVWMSVLNLSSQEASIDKAFTRLGGDSISAMQVVSRSRLHNIAFTVSDLLQSGTIRKLAARCQVISQNMSMGRAEQHMQEDVDTGEAFELSPIQQKFFDAYPDGLNHFNQSFVLELSKAVPTATLRNAFYALHQRHSILRARFNKNLDSGLWMQIVADGDDIHSIAFTEHCVEHREEVGKVGRLRQESFDIQNGPVFACDLFIIPDGNQILVLSAHHLVIDLVSWRIIWNDIEEFVTYGKLLSRSTTSFRTWCRRQAKMGSSLSPLSVLPYSIPEPQLAFWGLPLSNNTFAACEAYTHVFEEDISAALFGDSNESLRTEPTDIVLGAMVHSFLQTFPERLVPVVWIESHGREEFEDLPLDLSGTVGWFTTIHPLPVPIILESSVVDTIRITKDTRRKIPGKGQPYFACRYHSESGRQAFQSHDVVELMFNFTGRYQQLESEEGLFVRPEYLREVERDIVETSGAARRFTMIEINADVEEGLLAVTFQVHKNMKHQDRLREWTDTFVQTLQSVTEDLRRSAPSFTLSDLPLLSLSYSGLDTLLREQLPGLGIRRMLLRIYIPAHRCKRVSCSAFKNKRLLTQLSLSGNASLAPILRLSPLLDWKRLGRRL